MALNGIVPEERRSYGGRWGLAGEDVYRLVHISSSSDELNYAESCLQVLKPPYTVWENHLISPEDWMEGKNCRPWFFTWSEYFSGDGVLHVLLQEQEGASYLGSWTMEEGCSVVELEGEQMREEYFYDRLPEVWTAGEDFGLYFLYRQWVPEMEYQTLWLDKDNQEKNGMLQLSEGYVWDIEYNPSVGKTYLCGMLAEAVEIDGNGVFFSEGGFTVWREGENQPVFTAQDTNMSADSEIEFRSETEGYLWNGSGIWKFSMEEQFMEKIFSWMRLFMTRWVADGVVRL